MLIDLNQRNIIAQQLPVGHVFLEPNSEISYRSQELNIRIQNLTQSLIGVALYREDDELCLAVANAKVKEIASLYKYINRQGEQIFRVEPNQPNPELPADLQARIRNVAFHVVYPR